MREAASLCVAVLVLAFTACGPKSRGSDDTGGDDTPSCPVCSEDKTSVIDCNGNATQCAGDQACSGGMCMNACQAAEANHSSVGCDYYAVDMDAASGPPLDACFTIFVANTSRDNVKMTVEWGASQLNLAMFAKLPTGSGQSLTYAAYDPNVGLPPGKVAIIFAAYAPAGVFPGNVKCPVPAAIGTDAQISGTGKGTAFHIKTDLPVVAYQMLPYGGGAAAATGASLLLPTSAWGTNYLAVTAYDAGGMPPPISVPMGPSFNVVAMEDNTNVTIRPKSALSAGAGGLPAGAANAPYMFTLNKGQYAQFTQLLQLSGSPITADKPIGVFGGHQIMSIDRCCGDHGEQMLAPVKALGDEYVAAPHPDRRPNSEPRVFRIFGAVEGTQLTYDPPNAGPPTVTLGEWVEIRTATPFSVKSQDNAHPFAMFTYMTGAGEQGEGGEGDADFVRLVPPKQYQSHYVFFTDPSYPFTQLTVVRTKKDGAFKPVFLKCQAQQIAGWQPVGSGETEIAFVKVVDAWNPQNGCNNGVQQMDSEAPFGVWVWGWGSESTQTGWVSYGYPAGEGVLPINDVVLY